MQLEKYFRKPSIGTFASIMLALIVAGSSSINAQDDNENEIYELSPFAVDASEDTGYRATNTLAGTRIKTDLRDVASSISVYTKEFLDDIGASDTVDLLVYSTGTEVAVSGRGQGKKCRLYVLSHRH